MEIIPGKGELRALKHEYHVYRMMILFKKKASDLLQCSFADPLRNASRGSSDYHWKLQALPDDDGDGILILIYVLDTFF